MAILSYRDPATGLWAQLDAPTGPAGATGPVGAPGPTVVSTDAGNTAATGTDGLVYVPGLDTAAMDLDFVNLTGDTMTGELSLPDQVTVIPPVVPTAVAAKGYVDQVITVSDVDPVALPVRDGLIWNVVGEPTVIPSTGQITLTYPAGATAGFTVSGAYTVDWGDGSAIESFAASVAAAHTYAGASGSAVIDAQAGQSLTSFVLTSATTSPTGIAFDVPTLTHIKLNSSVKALQQVDFLQPVVLDVCAGLFRGQKELVSVTGSVGSVIPSYRYMFYECNALTIIPDLDTSRCTDFDSMFFNCFSLPAIPPLDTSSGTNFYNMFYGCNALTVIPPLDTSSGTIFYSMFSSCFSLTTIPLLDTSRGISFASLFHNCPSLTMVPSLDGSSGTEFVSMFVSCNELSSILMFGQRYTISVSNCPMDAAALNTFFTNLGTADNTAAQQVVHITNTPGAATCDRTIATAKGWTVTG